VEIPTLHKTLAKNIEDYLNSYEMTLKNTKYDTIYSEE
jgi:hypothetical protein